MHMSNKISANNLSKTIVFIVGISILSIVFTSFVKDKNSTSTFSSLQKKYDYYAKYDTDTTLGINKFKSNLVNADSLTKIRIDSLPNHATLKLNGTQVSEGQEVAVADLKNLVLRPFVDEYDTLKWSGFNGLMYLPSVISKIGVGGIAGPPIATTDFTLITPYNTSKNITLPDFVTHWDTASLTPLQLVAIRVKTLPQNGVLFVGSVPVTIDQIIGLTDFSTFRFVPTTNYVGGVTFDWQGYAADYGYPGDSQNNPYNLNAFGEPNSITSKANITIDPPLNLPPVISNPQIISTKASQSISFPPLAATDPNDDSVTFIHSAFPSGLGCVESNPGNIGNVITCTPTAGIVAGTYTFTVTPVDRFGLSGNSVTYTIKILAEPVVTTPAIPEIPTLIKSTLLRTGGV